MNMLDFNKCLILGDLFQLSCHCYNTRVNILIAKYFHTSIVSFPLDVNLKVALLSQRNSHFKIFLFELPNTPPKVSIFILQPKYTVQTQNHVQLFATPWTAACQASLSITISQSSLKLMSIELVMPSNHLILCHPLLFLPSKSTG